MVPSAFETCEIETRRRARPEQALVLLEDDLAALVDRRDAQLGALLRAELLPGDDVRVVFEPRDDDLVAGPDVPAAVALSHEVDGLGGAAHEDDVLGGGRVHEAARLLASCLVRVGRSCRECMSGAVDVRVLVLVEVAEPLDHRGRLRVVAALSSHTSGRLWTRSFRIGKSRLMA